MGRARTMQGLNAKESNVKELKNKRSILDPQIALLAERIGKLPEAIDPKPLIDQLGELQRGQVKINQDLKKISEHSNPDSKPISFESLEIFRLGLRDLIIKGENDFTVRAAILKIIVHKIDILKDGFEIHFHVGEAHYNQALEDQSPSASFFVSFARNSNLRAFKTKKPSGGLPPESSKLFSANEENLNYQTS